MRRFSLFSLCLVLLLSLGCARVRVEAPKEPIKMDISMRVDIYQHVQKDIDVIEDIVSGSGAKKQVKPSDKQSMKGYFMSFAYAQENLDPVVEEAALRRKERRDELIELEKNGLVGENKLGLAEQRATVPSDPTAEELIKQENKDRMIIYNSLAEKHNTLVEEIQKVYAQRLQENVSSGTPVEILDTSTGKYEWTKK